ncbi:sucrose-6-phosphate hydrolase [Staphylococcus aureus]|nr:sucrose-6-phosphate hydrolase [Staphylococcus aureus]
MWECPDYFNVDNQDVILICPQGIEPKCDQFNNIYQSGYILGKFDIEKLTYEHENFVELDNGFDFYAPQTFLDEKGRRVLIGWMGLPESNILQIMKDGPIA